MKAKYFLVLFIMICSAVFAKGSSKYQPCEKTFVDIDQLAISEEGIFVKMNQQWLQTEALHHEGKKLYFSNFLNEDWSMTWACPKCKFENSPFTNTCGRCGHRPRR